MDLIKSRCDVMVTTRFLGYRILAQSVQTHHATFLKGKRVKVRKIEKFYFVDIRNLTAELLVEKYWDSGFRKKVGIL